MGRYPQMLLEYGIIAGFAYLVAWLSGLAGRPLDPFAIIACSALFYAIQVRRDRDV